MKLLSTVRIPLSPQISGLITLRPGGSKRPIGYSVMAHTGPAIGSGYRRNFSQGRRIKVRILFSQQVVVLSLVPVSWHF